MDEEFINRMSQSFGRETVKIAQERVKTAKGILTNPYLLAAGAGVAGWEGLKKVDKDRKLGRALRMQQRGY